ncbi:MAG: hypothetical protein R3C05_31065 [Pirellulaceae bacterium]
MVGISVQQCGFGNIDRELSEYRLISVPRVGTQEEQDDFQGEWRQCSTETVGDFSAVGYFSTTTSSIIGRADRPDRQPWGGSACEAWVRRDLLQADEAYGPLLERWAAEEAKYEELSAAELRERSTEEGFAELEAT